MQAPFFITGLPRSRTAWFASYFDRIDGVTCHHELLARVRSKQEFYDAMEAGRHVGNSDCGLYLSDAQDRWPDARVLVVLRPAKDVVASLARAGCPTELAVIREMEYQTSKIAGLRVPYNAIDRSMQAIHEYLLPSVPYDEAHAGRMAQENIQNRIEGSPDALAVWR